MTSTRLFLTAVILQSITLVVTAQDLLPPETAIQDVIDHYVDKALQTGNVQATAQVDDYNLIRRTMLDLVGRIPTIAEVEAYVADKDPQKRVKLVDRLMQSEAFTENLTDDLNILLSPEKSTALKNYLRISLDQGKGWDSMFRDIIDGDYEQELVKEAMQFVRLRVNDLDNLTSITSSIFFGVNISCAKCHDHPLVTEWTQAHFYGMKSFFTRSFENGDYVAERGYGAIKYATVSGEQLDAKLMFLTGSIIDEPEWKQPDDAGMKAEKAKLEQLKKDKQPVPAPEFSRRSQLVNIALRENERDYFAKSIVNRMWFRTFGYGIVMPLDQMHPENPPSHPDMLDWLARDMYSNGYSLPRLIRAMVLSQAYSRSSRYDGQQRPARLWFAAANVKPLTPQQYAATLAIAARNPRHWEDPQHAEERIKSEVQAQRGWANRFVVPGEDFQVSVDEALLFSNNNVFKDKTRVGNDRLAGELLQIESNEEMIQRAIKAVYSRPASEEEIQVMSGYLKKRPDRREAAVQQIVWALLTGSELRFNY